MDDCAVRGTPCARHYTTVIIPLACYANIIRGVFLRGSRFGSLWRDALALLIIGIVVLTLASLRLRKSLD